MSKRQILAICGVWVMIFLFLGIPSSWHKIVAIATGAIIVLVTITLRPERRASDHSHDHSHNHPHSHH